MLRIALLPEEYAVCQLPAGAQITAELLSSLTGRPDPTTTRTDPSTAAATGLVSVTWTAEHVSIICRIDQVPGEITVETRWRCLRVLGPLDQAMTGTLAALVLPLTEARVSIVTFSAYDTDYLLVPTVRLTEALATLTHDGHRIAT